MTRLRHIAGWLLFEIGVAHHQTDCPVPANLTVYSTRSRKRRRAAQTADATTRSTIPDGTAE